MDWYYAIGDSKQGPVSEEKMRELVEAGFVGGDTLVWSADLPGWERASEVPALAPTVAARQVAVVVPARSDTSGVDKAETTQPAPYEDTEPHPWLRFFARIYDTWLFALAFTFGALIVLEATAPRLSEAFFEMDRALFSLLLLAAFIPIEALALSSHGTTPGKWLFGLRVMPAKGGRPSYSLALKRAAMVWWRGLGMGIPIVALITQARAHSKLTSVGQTSWDRDTDQMILHRPATSGRVALAVGVGIVLLAIYSFLSAYSATGY